MKRIFMMLALTICLSAQVATAQVREFGRNQDNQSSPSDRVQQAAPQDVEAQAEAGRKQAVQAKAVYRAQQRMTRISARQWTGNSAARPRVSPTSIMAPNSTFWGGNAHSPFGWILVR